MAKQTSTFLEIAMRAAQKGAFKSLSRKGQEILRREFDPNGTMDGDTLKNTIIEAGKQLIQMKADNYGLKSDSLSVCQAMNLMDLVDGETDDLSIEAESPTQKADASDRMIKVYKQMNDYVDTWDSGFFRTIRSTGWLPEGKSEVSWMHNDVMEEILELDDLDSDDFDNPDRPSKNATPLSEKALKALSAYQIALRTHELTGMAFGIASAMKASSQYPLIERIYPEIKQGVEDTALAMMSRNTRDASFTLDIKSIEDVSLSAQAFKQRLAIMRNLGGHDAESLLLMLITQTTVPALIAVKEYVCYQFLVNGVSKDDSLKRVADLRETPVMLQHMAYTSSL